MTWGKTCTQALFPNMITHLLSHEERHVYTFAPIFTAALISMHTQEQFHVLRYGASKYPPICFWDKHVSFPLLCCGKNSGVRPNDHKYDMAVMMIWQVPVSSFWVSHVSESSTRLTLCLSFCTIWVHQCTDMPSVQDSGSTDPQVWQQEGGGGGSWSSRRWTEVAQSSCACVYEQDSMCRLSKPKTRVSAYFILQSL